jgi:periplasmic protein TonB
VYSQQRKIQLVVFETDFSDAKCAVLIKMQFFMEPKKNKKAELENKKFLFLQIGFVTTLALLLIAFEWAVTPKESLNIEITGIPPVDIDIIPITFPKKVIPAAPAEIIPVEDHKDLINEVEIQAAEALPDTYIPFVTFSDPVENPDPGDETFTKVEDMPTFLGKEAGYFREWIYKNLAYPQKAIDNQIQGTVYISFVVNKDGVVSDIEIVRGVHPLLDNETIRVISSSPPWEPGRQWGKPVRVRFIFPLSFKLK